MQTKLDIRADPNITESLKCNVLLLAGEVSYKVEIKEPSSGRLRGGKLYIKSNKWLTRDWANWDKNTDMAVTIYSLLRAELCYEIRDLRAVINPSADHAVFSFYVVM